MIVLWYVLVVEISIIVYQKSLYQLFENNLPEDFSLCIVNVVYHCYINKWEKYDIYSIYKVTSVMKID